MISNVADFKNRTLVESNTLKSFILSTNDGFRSPQRDDILIHDYQIANSVTLNTILSNYIVNLKYAWNLYDNLGGNIGDTYFQIVEKLEEVDQTLLSDQTKLILDVGDGKGTFKARNITYEVYDLNIEKNTVEFVNLDTVWYGIVRNQDHDCLKIIPEEADEQGMNNFFVNPNPFGENVNPFDKQMRIGKNGAWGQSFNDFSKSRKKRINSVIENLFYKNRIDGLKHDSADETQFGQVIPLCKYLVCLSDRYYGLKPESDDGKFIGFTLYDIGSLIPNFDQSVYARTSNGYEFMFSGFHVVNDVNTLFIVFKDVVNGKDRYHYVFLNDDSYDKIYGFTTIQSIVVDQLIVKPEDVFSKVVQIKTLDSTNIALTDYGFWDLEWNTTNNVTYSFRWDLKDYSSAGQFNARKNKLVLPTTSLGTNDKVVEYNKVWTKLGDHFHCFPLTENPTTHQWDYWKSSDPGKTSSLPKYWLEKIVGTGGHDQQFVGGTQDFAVYNQYKNASTTDPINILVGIDQTQFNQLLYSMPELVSPFVRWMYDQVVYHTPADQGEYYLYYYHQEIAHDLNAITTDHWFYNLDYQIPDRKSSDSASAPSRLIPDKFNSIQGIVQSSRASATSLFDYCDTLASVTGASALGIDWLIGTENASAAVSKVNDKIMEWFTNHEYVENQKKSFVDYVVDTIIDLYKPLAYFRNYLSDHLAQDLSNFAANGLSVTFNGSSHDSANCQIDHTKIVSDVIRSVRNFIKSKVPTSLVLGVYDNSKTGNAKFNGLDSYIYQNRIDLRRSDVESIMSPMNTRNEIVAAVKSTPFFNQYETYMELYSALVDSTLLPDLFKISYNRDFANQSGLIDTNGRINLNWETIKGWLFPAENQPQPTLLKSFIRSQLYRPLFFKWNNYENFTSNNLVYSCKTKKSYINHNGDEKPLVFVDPDTMQEVNLTSSFLTRSALAGNYDVERVQYFNLVNALEYYLNYDPIQVVDNKFVFNDVEFYTVKVGSGSDLRVSNIYFNEFQNQVHSANKTIPVNSTNSTFVLNGKKYTIDDVNKVLLVESTKTEDDQTQLFDKEFRQEIVGDRFRIQGTWYVIRRNDAGKCIELSYSDQKDTELICIDVTTEGYGRYLPWGLEFQFNKSGSSIDWNTLRVFKKVQAQVIDRAVEERCYFDDMFPDTNQPELTEHKTWDWYLANEIVRMKSYYAQHVNALEDLGSGSVFSGGLELDNTGGTVCKLSIVNEIQEGYVISRGVLTKKPSKGEQTTQYIGILYDKDMNIVPGKTIRGNLTNDKLVNKTDSGNSIFVIKEAGKGNNNCNTIQIDIGTWNACQYVMQHVGSVIMPEEDSDSVQISISFNEADDDAPDMMVLTPVYGPEDDIGNAQIKGYVVDTSLDHLGQYTVNVTDEKTVHVISPQGHRYKIDFRSNSVSKLVFTEMQGSTMDFSTQYTYNQLRENLLTNIRQYMMNEIVQHILDNGSETTMAFNPRGLSSSADVRGYLGIYLELFSDSTSFDNYSYSTKYDYETAEGDRQTRDDKFKQVFKNCVNDISDSKIYSGKVQTYLNTKINSTFSGSNVVSLLNAPSVDVVLTSTAPRCYEFTYTVYIDIHLMNDKRLIKDDRGKANNDFKQKYIIGNAIVKDVRCEVKFTPVFNVAETMKYDVQYKICGGSYKVQYNQVMYNYLNKTKTKFIDWSIVTLPSMAQIVTPVARKTIDSMTTEFIHSQIESMLTAERRKAISIAVNDIVAGLNQKVQIASEVVKNRDCADGIWQLGASIPSTIPARDIVMVRRGKTIIDGGMYEVSDDDRYITQLDGDKRFAIQDVYVHTVNQNQDWVDGIRHTVKVVKLLDGNTNNAKVVVPMEGSNSIKENFTLQRMGNNLYMLYNNDPFPLKIESTSYQINRDSVRNVDRLKQYVNGAEKEYSTTSFYRITRYKRGTGTSAANPIKYVGQDEILLGETLSQEAEFKIQIDDWNGGDTYSTPVDKPMLLTGFVDKTETEVENDDGTTSTIVTPANDWIGIDGKFSVSITGLTGDDPQVNITSIGECWEFGDLPDKERDVYYVDSTVYTIVNGCANSFGDGSGSPNVTASKETYETAVDSEDDDQAEGDEAAVETVEKTRVIVCFRVKVRRRYEKLAVIPSPGEKYTTYGMYIEPNVARNIVGLTDYAGYSVGTLTYAYMEYITNLNDSSLESPKDFQYTDILFNVSWSGGTPSISSGGYYCPYTIQAIHPGASQTQDGDVYDRYYQTENRIYADPFTIGTYFTLDKYTEMFMMDKASILKSIRAKESTNNKYKILIYQSQTSASENVIVPETMREGVKKLVFNCLKLDNQYFTLMLTQLQTFLKFIDAELKQNESRNTWNSNEIRRLCKFKYDAKTTYNHHTEQDSKWNSETEGVFGYDREGDKYQLYKKTFNEHLYNQFFEDFSTMKDNTIQFTRTSGGKTEVLRDYYYILLKPSYDTSTEINVLKNMTLQQLFGRMNKVDALGSDIIFQIFNSSGVDNLVRYINAIKTSVIGDVKEMFVADGFCHLFSLSSSNTIQWHKFQSDATSMSILIDNKRVAAGSYTYDPTLQMKEFQMHPIDASNNWIFRMANRDLSSTRMNDISDAFVVRCQQTFQNSSDKIELWYLSEIDKYIYANSPLKIVDMAYEQNGDSVYVLFKDDHYMYRYDHLALQEDSQKRVLLKKENATMKIETKHSVYITDKNMEYNYVYVDYGVPEYQEERLPDNWRLNLYGTITGASTDRETWNASPGLSPTHFKQYNTILFGDSMFNEDQLRFQNVSKNKEMFDILDVDEVDGCYYGLFKDESTSTEAMNLGFDTYTVFKTARSGGVVQKLPYIVVNPNLYRTADQLYSLFVLVMHRDSEDQEFRLRLQEISVPDNPVYSGRVIELQRAMENRGVDVDGLEIRDVVLSRLKVNHGFSYFFVLDNKDTEFHKVKYGNDFEQMSIDTTLELQNALEKTLRSTVMESHMDEMHHGEQAYYFDEIAKKINQFADDFTVFDLIPAEFGMTQDVGVIPDSKVDDTDTLTDHRVDSVQVSTDVLWTDGMVAQTDSNPGIITAAVSNPATIYDDDSVFTKSQRNPSIEGSEFYDFIYDQKGNTLMDLYAIPFIYRVNTNNTYDLYINVPTTRTKYLNRIAGTLKDNGTSQVLAGDTRTRRNFLDEPMANNLDESTTRLRIYIDRKYVSVGNVELVEISGNSIPLQIYRDVPNDGLYDSIALESRWDGEVNEINEPAKDINKVMLEFECYGTDSQSIHISGKTLINRALDDGKYVFG